MNTCVIKEWLEFPLSVFVDTQAFIKESYDFSTKGKFALLEKQIRNRKVQLLTSVIVKGEVERHIKEDVGKRLDKLRSALDDRRLAIFREGSFSTIFQPIDQHLMTESAIKTFNDYLASVAAIWLDINDINLHSVLNDYFSSKPPFGESHKKSEFPDAFIASLLQKYSSENGKVYVVSDDGDFSNVENIYCFKTLSDLLNAINSQNEISQRSKDYVNSASAQPQIFNKVEKALMDVGNKLDVEGTDTDRKGFSSGYEYDEKELLSVSTQKLTELQVVDIEYTDSTITVMTNCKSILEFICTFFDEENSVWDSVDKEYAHAHYGTMHEFHNALIPVTIYLTFENDGENIVLDISEVTIDTKIKFDQLTLRKDGRNRIDNPYSYWEDNE